MKKTFVPMLTTDLASTDITDMVALEPQAALENAINACVEHILDDYGWDEENFNYYEITTIREGFYKVSLNFVYEVDDEPGEYSPSEEICYIFEVKK